MKLHQAFEITPGDVVAFIGAGGKTSTMVSLGYELAELGWRVLATTTTQLGEHQLELVPRAMSCDAHIDEVSAALTEDHFVFLFSKIENGQVFGVAPEHISSLIDSIDSDVILIEADESGGLPLKAPLPNEPTIPVETSLVIPTASLTALGQPLDNDHIYNARAMVERYGFQEGSRVKSPWISQVIRDDELGLRGVPKNARILAFLNQAPIKGYGRARARLIAKLALKQSRLSGVALGSVRGAEPVYEVQRSIGAIVLAAGLSSRMGEPKVLLPWTEKKSIIEHIIEQLYNARVDHITVVTGHAAKEVKERVSPLGVKVAFNRSYKTGEMLSSVKAGLRAMPDNVAAALIVLGDQPRIQPKVVYHILTAFAEGAGDIIAPSYKMRRGHPILIGRRYWNELLSLPRNAAPRDVINAHADQVHYVNVDSDSILRDVDTPEDYAEERWRAGL